MFRTWDIFDTLVGRKCIFPQEVFKIMEEKCNLKGFANARVMAENILSKENPNYKIDDIYSKICDISNLTSEVAEKLKKLEFQVELEQAIPIIENIKQVKAGDTLISDMYLPKYVVKSMLDKVGLTVPVNIVITTNGKSSGRIWQQIKEQNLFVSHTGDNNVSDIKIPKGLGFEANLSSVRLLTDYEKYIFKYDRFFAEYLREIRLKNPFNDAVRKLYWRLFTVNIGVLMIFAKQIYSLHKKYHYDYFGFMGRDVYYLKKVFDKLVQQEAGDSWQYVINEKTPEIEYLYYSRALVLNSGQTMRKYLSFKTKGKKALLIDLRGTGVHLKKLVDDSDIDADLLLCIWLGAEEALKSYNVDNVMFKSYQDKCEVSNKSNLYIYNYAEKVSNSADWDDTMEVINRAPHNSPIKMNIIDVGEEKVPDVIFSEVDDTEYLEVFEQCMQFIMERHMCFPKSYEELDKLSLPLLNVIHANKNFLFREKHINGTLTDLIAFGHMR